ncbi:LPS export ABC transporter permease LptG [Corticibacter populi]|uniref:LPS export ABC transporter permease LptG n=1 Tax=Corticibacter populi TaxID=1550736 RepID=A0A3M6QU33_9BURK|nr:LPS export ABC transporter permease LptG [Corticibacter populi]RMX05992.1 LPS export ABC transporter permease LptG [Corticibacter populi]RZS30677.1 lipopolysaccharide export system permease protein [Corticibacter populi]
MKIVTRMLQQEIAAAVAMATVAFLALLMFFDLISESRFVSRTGIDSYGVTDVLVHLLLSAPMHVYELLPICVLIGAVFVMARYAQTSQFTILRTGGLGPGRALSILLALGLAFTALTFVVGDYLAPWGERTAQLMRARHLGQIVAGGGSGAWLRERQGDDSIILSVSAMKPDGRTVDGVRIFHFAADGRLQSQIRAQSADLGDGAWTLHQASEEVFQASSAEEAGATATATAGIHAIRIEQHPQMQWPTDISAEMVNAAILKPDGMSTLQLFNYVAHLKANGQSAQRYELELWRKVFYPLGCLVMMLLALPFAYLHFRSGGIMGYVFIGILTGISYLLLNNVLGYMGNIRNWSPLLTAAVPPLLYTLLALGIFNRMVRRQ